MKFVLITSGIHDRIEMTALLLEPNRPLPLALRAQRFLELQPEGSAEAFADWLENTHGYHRLTFTEAWLPPSHARTSYQFSVEVRT